MPEHGSSTTRYECAVFIILASHTALIPIAFTKKQEILDARSFNLKLRLAIATIGKGIMNTRKNKGNRSFLRCTGPRDNKISPVIIRIRAKPELKYTCHKALIIWMRIPAIKMLQPSLYDGAGVWQ